jgi:hypothetical protein
MGRNLKQIIAELPPARQQRIEDRYQALKQNTAALIAASALIALTTCMSISTSATLGSRKYAWTSRYCR